VDIKELQKKLDPANVKKHPFSGMDYIEGWHAIAEANRIFGHDAWSRETVYNKMVAQYEKEIGKQKEKGYKVVYEALVKITVGGVERYGTGHGTGQAKDLGDCIEGAAKEAETDAMKRALMTFGNPFGLALYDKTKANVGVDKEPAGIHMTLGEDDVDPQSWLEQKIEGIFQYIDKPRSTLEKFAEGCVKSQQDPIYSKLDDEQKDTYEIAVKDAEFKLKLKLQKETA
jgi:hypothetical protein